ncbi:MAG: c-type cytochrome [Thiotrichales bacterium]
MTLKTLIAASAIATLVGVQSHAFADDNRLGRTIGVTCAGCHGTDGKNSWTYMHSITELSADEIEKKLLDFRAGKADATIMNRIAKGYTDEQIKAVANYFGNMSK